RGGVRAGEEPDAGGEPGPTDFAGEAERVEERRFVAVDAQREDVALPGVRGDFESVELFDDFVNAVDAGQARRRRHVLPGEEEAHEVGGGDRLDLGAQTIERVAVDAREESS